MITGAYGYGPDYPETMMSQREAVEQQRQNGIGLGQYAHNMAQQQERLNPKAILGALGPGVMKESNISVNLERMDKILSHQEERMTELEQRLTPFVRPYPKQTREEGHKTATSQSALSERLHIQTQRADLLCTRINALIENIDL